MTRNETTKILAILEATYPTFYKDKNDKELNDVVSIWSEMFKEEPYELVTMILKEVIATSEYPPTIATIKNKIKEISIIDEESNSELWEKLLKAIRNGYYGAVDEFNKLPGIVKEFVGSPRQLQELAEMDSDTIHSVVKGQFLKQIEIIKERQRAKEQLSPDIKRLLFGNKNETLKAIDDI